MPRQATAENEPSLAISRRTHRKSGSSQGTGEVADGRVEFGAVAHAGGLDGGGELIEGDGFVVEKDLIGVFDAQDDGFAKERKLMPV